MKNFEKFEERAEELRELVNTLCDELQASQPISEQQRLALKDQLKGLANELDRLDAILINAAIKTDKPDDPIVTF